VGRQLHVYQLARLYRAAGMLIRGGIRGYLDGRCLG
jgi:hypothetical protein